MSWFRQAQSLKDSSVTNSTLQQTQAGRDALSFQNSEQVTIVYNGWFGARQVATGIDWEWAGRIIQAQQAEVRNRLKGTSNNYKKARTQGEGYPEKNQTV
jgi:hypothetical protein